ncbi:MAG: hypothetical protein J0H43_16140 [Actinobacteria bacterium]|nr:hypothetical protein [Actinomycetota bacterium]
MTDSDDLYGDSVYEGGDAVDDSDLDDPTSALTGDDQDELAETDYSPPDREPYNLRHFPTGPESLDEHLAEEEPDVWADEPAVTEADPRAGRLVGADPSEVSGELAADDVGPAGYASSAEEAAVHVVDEERPL